MFYKEGNTLNILYKISRMHTSHFGVNTECKHNLSLCALYLGTFKAQI